jgi:Flp pilus assembly pilin Flp
MRKLKSRGAALVDYGLIIGLVSIAAIGAVNSTGEKTESIYCMASNGLSRVTGAELDPDCIFNPQQAIELAVGERFVTSPRRMEAAFTDVTFPNDKTGEHLVLSQVATKPDTSYSLKTSISSLDAYDPERTVSSCYLLSGDIDPICSEPSDISTLWVPAEAEAIGYAISLNEDTDMPWSSDVAIAVPQDQASITIADGSWNVTVSRENAPPVVENVSVLFASPYSYQRENTGWTYGEFAAIEGKFNQDLTFEISNIDGVSRSRKACYKGTATSQPVCTASTSSNSTARITVPAGAAQVGYEVELPAKYIGADWSVRETLVLRQGASEKHRQEVTIVRPNEPANPGSLAAAFSPTYTYTQSDTGWIDGEFVAISTPRNVTLSFAVKNSGSADTNRRACYKLVAGGEAICGADQYYTWEYFQVPPGAVEVGYQVQLPAKYIGADWTSEIFLDLQGAGKSMHYGKVTLVRPNEPYEAGGIATQFSTPYRYKQADAGWIDGEFLTLTGKRNTSMTLEVNKVTGSTSTTRKACYKLVAGGQAICSASENYYAIQTTIPPEAVEVGYQVQLPDPYVGADWTADIYLTLNGGGKSIFSGKVSLIRPNEPYNKGGISAAFQSPYNFQQTDTGWTDGEFVTLTGNRNMSLTMGVNKSGSTTTYRKACYRLEAGGPSICGAENSYYEATVTVPMEAVEVGYQIQLAAEGAGPAWTADIYLNLSGLFSGQVSITRPNAPYEAGALESQFTTPYQYAETDTNATYGEFIGLTGPRNTGLSFTMKYSSGSGPNRAPCYRLVAGGEPTCASVNSGTSVSIVVPTNAVEVGYIVYLPSRSAGPAYSTTQILTLSGGGKTLFSGPVQIERPNAAYNSGSISPDFSSTYTFAPEAKSTYDGEYVRLSGDHNHSLYLALTYKAGSTLSRQVCYRMEVGGTATCSGLSSSGTTYIYVPVGAVEVGYRLSLPTNTAGYTTDQQLKLSGGDATLVDKLITITRPAS